MDKPTKSAMLVNRASTLRRLVGLLKSTDLDVTLHADCKHEIGKPFTNPVDVRLNEFPEFTTELLETCNRVIEYYQDQRVALEATMTMREFIEYKPAVTAYQVYQFVAASHTSDAHLTTTDGIAIQPLGRCCNRSEMLEWLDKVHQDWLNDPEHNIDWSAATVAYYESTGFTDDGDLLAHVVLRRPID